MDIPQSISCELNIEKQRIINTINLLKDESTIPFIARYRKDQTGNLDEEDIRRVEQRYNYLINLEKRKEEISISIQEQGKLTEEIKERIRKASKLQELEDIYLPYKKKRKTRADIAREKGLEPFSRFFLRPDITIEELRIEGKKYINNIVSNIEEAIEGAKLILAQDISEKAQYRSFIRKTLNNNAYIISKLIKKNIDKDEKRVFQDYYDFSESTKLIPSHRLLALNRGEKENILKISIYLKEKELDQIKSYILRDFQNKNLCELYTHIITDSLNRLILPSMERECRNTLTEKAEIDAIRVFQNNLKGLLMQPPIYNKNILGIDPAFKTGCKIAVIDKQGAFKENDIIFLSREAEAKTKLERLINKHDIDIIAIGNGTASRETESFISQLLTNLQLSKEVLYIIVNEAGASVYSASKIAREEFPDLDITVRGAISIARRVQDPLAELVKIDPKAIGIGMYQHDINQKTLESALKFIVEKVVNNIGVNINTASYALLSYISGISNNIAKKIIEYRMTNNKIKDRNEIRKIKGIGEKAFTLSAGFILIPDSENPLDNTIIHPESYHIAIQILKYHGLTLRDLKESPNKVKESLSKFDINDFIKKKEYGKETIRDIISALKKERRDPREYYPQPLLRKDILKPEDLKEGMELEGTIRNIVKFGAFIDIGLKNDALLHISQMSDKFIKDPMDLFSVGEIIKVIVKSIDLARGRIALSLKKQ